MKKGKVVFLPGFGADEALWEPVCQQLSDVADTQVIVFDAQDSREAMVEKVLKQAPEQFILVGHSMGGWVAQEIASKHPERVLKLILISTWTNDNPQMIAVQEISKKMIEDGQFEQLMQGFLPRFIPMEKLNDQKLMATIQSMFMRRDAQTLCNQLSAMNRDYGTLSLLKAISAPTLVIHASKDALFSKEEQETLAKNISNAKLAVIENCGHMAPLEDPAATAKLIRSWL